MPFANIQQMLDLMCANVDSDTVAVAGVGPTLVLFIVLYCTDRRPPQGARVMT